MDKEQALDAVEKYSELVKQNYNVRKIVLYGSYSRGEQKEWSDIDIAVFLNEKEKDILASEFNLYKLRRNIDLRIEPIILDEENDESGFARDVLNNGIIIYQSN